MTEWLFGCASVTYYYDKNFLCWLQNLEKIRITSPYETQKRRKRVSIDTIPHLGQRSPYRKPRDSSEVEILLWTFYLLQNCFFLFYLILWCHGCSPPQTTLMSGTVRHAGENNSHNASAVSQSSEAAPSCSWSSRHVGKGRKAQSLLIACYNCYLDSTLQNGTRTIQSEKIWMQTNRGKHQNIISS